MEPLEPAPPTGRPQLITNLGILTFINTGFFVLVYGMGVLGMAGVQSMPRDEFDSIVQPQLDRYFSGPQMEDALLMMDVVYQHGFALMGILFLRTLLRLAGALGMWRGRMWGFYLYAFAQLASIFAPHLILPWKFLGLGGPLVAVAMTALYGTQRRFLS